MCNLKKLICLFLLLAIGSESTILTEQENALIKEEEWMDRELNRLGLDKTKQYYICGDGNIGYYGGYSILCTDEYYSAHCSEFGPFMAKTGASGTISCTSCDELKRGLESDAEYHYYFEGDFIFDNRTKLCLQKILKK